jgi:hypothetical protein
MTFQPVTTEQFALLQARARAAGIAMDGPVGRASQFGAEVAWEYRSEERSLTMKCLQAPFFMTREAVEEKIQKLVRESLQ